MKNSLKFIAASFLVAFSPSAFAIDPWPVYATGGTIVGSGTNYAVISAHSVNGGAPVITYLNATGDSATNRVLFYSASVPQAITNVNSTVTLPVTTNINGFVAGAIVIIRHVAADTYERRVISSVTTSTVVLTVAPTSATATGDQLYLATPAGYIPVGVATLSLTGPGIYSGQRQRPLLLDIQSVTGTNATINAVAAEYIP